MNRILLLVDNRENRRLLTQWLSARYRVLPGQTDESLDEEFDLCLIDGPALDRLWERAQARKEKEQPVFLPLLLITARQDVGLVTRHLWKSIDELIISPVEKVELQARIEILLLARTLSLTVQSQAEEKYRRIFDNAVEGIFQIAADGRLLTANPALARMLGYETPAEMIAGIHDLRDTLYVEPQSGGDLLRSLEERRVVRRFEAQLGRSDDKRLRVSINAVAVSDPKTGEVYYEGIVEDVTERKRTEEKLAEYTASLEALSRQLLEAHESERRRIACELHDEIGQALTAVKMNLQFLRRLPDLSSGIEQSLSIVDDALQQVRGLSLDLRPSILDDLGLAPALRWYIGRHQHSAETRLETDIDRRLPSQIETVCFRIAQEAMTNAIRHSQARSIDVELRDGGAFVELIIRDDGTGFDVAAAQERASRGKSLGLLGMQERARLAGGSMEIKSEIGKGTKIHARFPISGGAKSRG
jgi:PAS domain S-box-containing protein